MGAFVKGDVVVAYFPFSDLTGAKKRPALVVATLQGDDIILCQITSQNAANNYTVPIIDQDFTRGGLRQKSNVRPNRLFTAESSTIDYQAGALTQAKMAEVLAKLIQILSM